MHDWTLRSIIVEWEAGTVTIALTGPTVTATLVGHDVQNLQMPRHFAWGRSVSVNQMDGPTPVADGFFRLSVEMQSGDIIEIVAASFDLPGPQR
jgi:hypothetical protein